MNEDTQKVLKDKSNGTVIEGTGSYVGLVLICVLFAKGLIWAKLDGSGVGFAVGMITATVILALYWWFFRMMVHKVVDATYDKATERTDSSKFRTIDCMKLKNDYTLKYYSYAITVILVSSVFNVHSLYG